MVEPGPDINLENIWPQMLTDKTQIAIGRKKAQETQIMP
jgi:hypothetical protein